MRRAPCWSACWSLLHNLYGSSAWWTSSLVAIWKFHGTLLKTRGLQPKGDSLKSRGKEMFLSTHTAWLRPPECRSNKRRSQTDLNFVSPLYRRTPSSSFKYGIHHPTIASELDPFKHPSITSRQSQIIKAATNSHFPFPSLQLLWDPLSQYTTHQSIAMFLSSTHLFNQFYWTVSTAQTCQNWGILNCLILGKISFWVHVACWHLCFGHIFVAK